MGWAEAASATIVPVIKPVSSCRGVCWCATELASCLLWLAKEGRDENTGVKVECGMPPSVRKIQHLNGVGHRV